MHLPARSIYRLLWRNQWAAWRRRARAPRHPVAWVLMGALGTYVALLLLLSGWYFDQLVYLNRPGAVPIRVLNAYLLPGLLLHLCLRFLLQRPPSLKLQPYRHLPLPQTKLVRFFQGLSLLSIHNGYPFLFLLPFWARHVWGTYPPGGAVCWLLGLTLALLLTHYLNTSLRLLMSRREGMFYLLIVALMGAWLLDQRLAYPWSNQASQALFDALLGGAYGMLVVWTLALGMAAWVSSRALLAQLRTPLAAPQREQVARGKLDRLAATGLVGQYLVLEMKLLWRNRRPRHYALMSVLFSTVYALLFLLLDPGTGQINGALVGLYATGSFVLNYGQLMFAWESVAFEGLLARQQTAVPYVQAKLALLQGSTVLFYLLSLPVFLLAARHLLLLHLAFLLYNAGVTSVLVLALALRNRNPVDISQSGGFFNYEGFSWTHWLWFLPTAVPPLVILAFFGTTPIMGYLFIGGLGLIGLALHPAWVHLCTRTFTHQRLSMAAAFRDHAS